MRVRNETGSVARMVVRKYSVSNPSTGYVNFVNPRVTWALNIMLHPKPHNLSVVCHAHVACRKFIALTICD